MSRDPESREARARTEAAEIMRAVANQAAQARDSYVSASAGLAALLSLLVVEVAALVDVETKLAERADDDGR